jgi:hypothetical protein
MSQQPWTHGEKKEENMVKAQDVANYAKSLIGVPIDEDKYAGAQCMDFTVHIMRHFFNWWPSGNAIDLATQSIPAGFTRFQVTNASQIQAGDVLIWGAYWNIYGHTGIAVENGSTNGTFKAVEQNWNNPNWQNGSPAQLVTHDMTGFWGVIRPNYEKDSTNSSDANKVEETKKKGEVTMQCFYKIDGKATVYYFDGLKVRKLNNPDELKVLNQIYKANNGQEIPVFNWSSKAPWYDRLLGVLNRGTI